jgi:hypothetical protein
MRTCKFVLAAILVRGASSDGSSAVSTATPTIRPEEVCVFGLDLSVVSYITDLLSSSADSLTWVHLFDVYPWTQAWFLDSLREKFPGRVLHGPDYAKYWSDWTRGPRCQRVVIGASQAVTEARLSNVLIEDGQVEFAFLEECRGSCQTFKTQVCSGADVCVRNSNEVNRQILNYPISGSSDLLEKASAISQTPIASYLQITKEAFFVTDRENVTGACFSRSDFNATHACKPAVYPCLQFSDFSGFSRQQLLNPPSCPHQLIDILGYMGRNLFDVAVFQEDYEVMLGLADSLELLDVGLVVFIGPKEYEGDRLLPVLMAELDHRVLRQGYAKIWSDDDGHYFHKITHLTYPINYNRLAFRTLDQELTKITDTWYFDDRVTYSE